ncbi:cytochrome c oxidase subunit II [Synechocystis sp. LKSZ1]|uniref:cytochrome c oxidase subunit II n=1 Tax=Synechocystis sp. LKSZ1 TaxID=3144951 RepID=UPI00336C2B24
MQAFNWLLLTVYTLMSLALSHWLGQQAYGWLPPAAALEAEPIGDLLSFMTRLATLIFMGVMGALLYSLLFYRARPGQEEGAPIRGNTQLEIIWTVIPILLVTWIALYSYQIYQRMNVLGPLPIVEVPNPLDAPALAQGEASPSSITVPENIEVRVKQWAWAFTYPRAGVTSAELHLPVNRPIHFQMTSEDVIHGFYIPNFRLKQDIVPNRTIELSVTPSREGQYQLRDSQYSGTYFAVMTAPVFVESPAAYEQWLQAQVTSKPSPNPAHQEHQNPPPTRLKSGWPTVKPVESFDPALEKPQLEAKALVMAIIQGTGVEPV